MNPSRLCTYSPIKLSSTVAIINNYISSYIQRCMENFIKTQNVIKSRKSQETNQFNLCCLRAFNAAKWFWAKFQKLSLNSQGRLAGLHSHQAVSRQKPKNFEKQREMKEKPCIHTSVYHKTHDSIKKNHVGTTSPTSQNWLFY